MSFMRGWLKEGQPACFPLPVFFFPQGFMTGTLQTFARKYQVEKYKRNILLQLATFRRESTTEDNAEFFPR